MVVSDPEARNSRGLRLENEDSVERGVDGSRRDVERRPRVDGIGIVSGSSVPSTYMVVARGGGATRSSLS